MPYAKKRSYKRKRKASFKKKKSGQSSIKNKYLNKSTGKGIFQLTRSIPNKLSVQLKYNGQFTMYPHTTASSSANPREPFGFVFEVSSLNPGLHQVFGGSAVRNWPYGGTVDPSNPTSVQVIGMDRMSRFYNQAIMLHTKITYRIRIATGQQPHDLSAPGGLDPSYVNDFFVSLQSTETTFDSDTAFDKIKTSGRRIRIYNKMAGHTEGGCQFSIEYTPQKRLGIVDPQDNAQLQFGTSIGNNRQPQPVQQTHAFVVMTPARNRSGGDLRMAHHMPKFFLDYQIEYTVQYTDKIADFKRSELPLVWKRG